MNVPCRNASRPKKMRSVEQPKARKRSARWKRRATKTTLFCALLFLVLNPNLKRFAQQVRHVFAPDSLIQTDFEGMAEINRQIDELRARWPRRSEVKLIENFVLKRIRYSSDYRTWGNMEYWPTAEEVWRKGEEDCDGRAILATSILRSRGYQSARLAISLDHMWAEVNSREKQQDFCEEITRILNPDTRFRTALDDKPTANHFARLAKAFLRPTAFRDTSANLLSAIPFARKAILLTALLILCYHPCRNWRGFVALLGLEVVALSFFAVSDARVVDSGYAALGLAFAGFALLCALLARRLTAGMLLEQASSRSLTCEK
jgi:predicted transglutaminase-like cysteine proteinase